MRKNDKKSPNIISEKDLEDFIVKHCGTKEGREYLRNKGLNFIKDNSIIERQVKIFNDSFIPDLVQYYFNEFGILEIDVIELKINRLKSKDIDQISKYYNFYAKSKTAIVTGRLLAKPPKEDCGDLLYLLNDKIKFYCMPSNDDVIKFAESPKSAYSWVCNDAQMEDVNKIESNLRIKMNK